MLVLVLSEVLLSAVHAQGQPRFFARVFSYLFRKKFCASRHYHSAKKTLIDLPNKYPLYGVAKMPGDPGILGETSKTTISFFGGPAVIIDCKLNGPMIPGGIISLAAFTNFSPISKAGSRSDSSVVTAMCPASSKLGLVPACKASILYS